MHGKYSGNHMDMIRKPGSIMLTMNNFKKTGKPETLVWWTHFK